MAFVWRETAPANMGRVATLVMMRESMARTSCRDVMSMRGLLPYLDVRERRDDLDIWRQESSIVCTP